MVSASFSDSGEYVATSSKDRTAIVWKLDAEKPGRGPSHKNQVKLAVFTDDPRYLVTACRDGTARIWSTSGGGRAGRHAEAIGKGARTSAIPAMTRKRRSGIFSLTGLRHRRVR